MSSSRSISRGELSWLVLAMIFPSLLTWAYFFAWADAGLTQKLIYGGGKVFQFAIPLIGWAWFSGQMATRDDLRESTTSSSRTLIYAVAFGLVVTAAMGAFYILGGKAFIQPLAAAQIQGKLRAFGIHTPAAYLLLSLFYCLAHSGLEEYYWRWYVFRGLNSWLSAGTAAAISALAFMAHHVLVLGAFFGWQQPWGYLFSAAVAVGGFAWALLYRHAGWRLSVPWVSHALIDAGIFAIGLDLAFGS